MEPTYYYSEMKDCFFPAIRTDGIKVINPSLGFKEIDEAIVQAKMDIKNNTTDNYL